MYHDNLLQKARSRMEDVVNGLEDRSHLEEVIEEIDVYLNPKTVTCPQCGVQATNEEGCGAADSMETMIEDHGMCRNCHEKWQYQK